MIFKKASVMVPNMFTVSNMFLGFFALIAAFEHRWIAAPTAIFIAHIMDILDGRLARWMGVTSQFGGEFDSFADWISFGIAPAYMVYILALKEMPLGLLLTFLYILAGAFRLARFNVKSYENEESAGLNFSGLPIPVAGGFLSVLVLLFGLAQNENQGKTMDLIYNQIPMLRAGIPVIMFGLAMLMMSRIQYSTFKKMHFFRPQSTPTFLIMLLVCFLIYEYPQNTIFIIYTSYIMWGLIKTGWRAYRIRRKPA